MKRSAFLVQWSMPPSEGQTWRRNEEALVICETGQEALAEVLRLWPKASVHQLLRRSTRVLIVEAQAAP